MTILNVYCDESCHLENDGGRVMVLGALACPRGMVSEVSQRCSELRRKHDIPKHREVKWVKVSKAKVEFYLDLVELFFSVPELRFRAVVADKTSLDHDRFKQDHDDWYFKMYFYLLRNFVSEVKDTSNCIHVYLDIKDTRSARKTAKLRKVLSAAYRDFSDELVPRIQIIRSHESELAQLADLLLGAVSYANRDLHSSDAKERIVSQVAKSITTPLTESTSYGRRKFNLFQWVGQKK